jgi:excisionase family DNA binding protein
MTNNTNNTDQSIMTVKQLSTYLHCHPSSIYRIMNRNDPNGPPGFRVGSDWRFRREAIDKWIITQEEEPHAKTLR